MASTRFSADYAKRASNCKKCKGQLTKGVLRIAKIVPNPFGSEGGDMKQYFHPKCLFESFEKARSTTVVIESPTDIEQWASLEDSDKEELAKLIKNLSKKREEKKGKVSPVKKQKAEKTEQPKISQMFGGGGKEKEIDDSAAKSENREKSEASSDSAIATADDSWAEFCKLCSRIASNSKYTTKSSVVKNFIQKGSREEGYEGDLYALFKMLLPGVDQRVYNVKDKQLIKLFSQIFGCESEEMMDNLMSSGDVSETIRVYFDKSFKFRPCKTSSLSIFDVDKWLNEMTLYTKEDDQQKHLEKIARKCTSEDLAMIIKEIKSDLRINAGAKHVLDALGTNAYEAFQASRNLKDVIMRFLAKQESPGGMNKQLSIGIQLGTPVLPMLAEACRSIEYAMKKCPNGMYAEIKYDGERVQLHKHGNSFHYFSRSLKPVQEHKINHFKNWIPKAFPEGGDLILDSEVLLIDRSTGKPLPFGSLGKHKKEAFDDANVCLFVFDCILFQGKSLMDKSIKERKKLLNENMQEIPNRVMFSDMEYIKHGDNAKLKKMINKAINEGLEGLVLKDAGSVYEPGKRHWLKVKKDYLQEGAMADAADLIVLGAYYGTGSKGGMMSVFLMGCHDIESGRFLTVTKCGNGHDDATLDRINVEMKEKMVKIGKDYDKLPSWIRCGRSLVPDFVVKDPKKAPVWEITGAEFSKSENHTADGISIRFPRVTKIRNDKDWEGATNLDELKKLYSTSKEKTDFLEEEEETEGPSKKKAKVEECVSSAKEIARVTRGHSLNQLFARWDESGAEPNADSESTTEESTSTAAEDSNQSGKDDSTSQFTKLKPEKLESSSKESSSGLNRKKKKEACKYGGKCYQKNPEHKRKFWHPGDPDDEVERSGENSEAPSEKEAKQESDSEEVELNLFSGIKVFLAEGIENEAKLTRYINFYDGEVVDKYSLADATHVVSDLTEKVEDMPGGAVQVHSSWLWDTIKKQKRQPIGKYRVK